MNPLTYFDAQLNRYTMYRVMVYGLSALLLAAVLLGLTGAVAVPVPGLLAAVAVLAVSCYISNRAIATLMRVPYNSESWLITALILALIMPAPTSVAEAGLLALAGLIAMLSKYALVLRGTHFLNPAAFGAFVLGVSGLMPATWWVATPSMVPFTALVGLAVLRKQRKFSLFAMFAACAVLMMLYIGAVLHGRGVAGTLNLALMSWPVIFFGTIMLTEPGTLPPTLYYQLLFGAAVGVLFASQLHAGALTTTPEAALLVGNILTLGMAPAMGAMLKLKKVDQLGPNAYDLVFERPKNLRFSPGQYMEWTLPHRGTDARGNRRTFSIASAPTEPDLRIGIKTYKPSSSFKKALLALEPGARVRAAHVAGNFTLENDPSKPLVFIAGGIGITPFRSMLKYLTDKGQKREIHLLYAGMRDTDFVYKDVLKEAEAVGLKTHYITGFIQEDYLRDNLPLLKHSTVYISGPDAMVSHCTSLLLRLGVPYGSIETDHFSGY